MLLLDDGLDRAATRGVPEANQLVLRIFNTSRGSLSAPSRSYLPGFDLFLDEIHASTPSDRLISLCS